MSMGRAVPWIVPGLFRTWWQVPVGSALLAVVFGPWCLGLVVVVRWLVSL